MKKDECKEQSRVTRWMHNLKETNPEKYAEALEKKRIRDARYRENHPGRTSKWRHGLKETNPKKYAEVNANWAICDPFTFVYLSFTSASACP